MEAATLDALGAFSAADPATDADSSFAEGSRRPAEPPVLLLVKPNGDPVYRDAA